MLMKRFQISLIGWVKGSRLFLAPWLIPDGILYRCGRFDWVSLLGI
ncbi:hypothetical protein Gohar_028059 [Gossypium harknessii]|uniref:Uncharacterized protein n=1 Tax=Gossypium harknessii TaxID=34285 RepID=A0A7J9IAG4_9ROSI|nr:hypothetical protein [Gossypium harknessii]